MPPKRRTTRATSATTTTPTITVTDAQLHALIDRGVVAALEERNASRSRDGDNSHGSGTGGRRQVPTQRECTYTDFLKCPPMNFKGTEGVPIVDLQQRFQVGQLMCVEMFLKEGSLKLKIKSMLTAAERQAENKRKFEDTSRNNQNQQQPFKRNNVARAYTAGPGDKKPYGGTKPLCTRKTKRDHLALALECGSLRSTFRSDCPKLKNGNQGNRAGNGNVVARAYAVGSAGTNPNSNVVTGTFLLNNRYASILFDTGSDRSFISIAFSSLIDIIPTTLDHGYDVALADEMGSFDFIIGMDRLAKYHAVIVCDEKLVCVPFGDEILIFHGDESNNGHESRLNIISCTKTQKYLLKGCPIFLVHVTTKKAEDKSKEKRLEDVPIVQDFPEVFPEDLSGIPPTLQVEFQIDLMPGVAPVT
ncbi:putative reverse transcriptase domain-containing protein [Tanacetum coccineum]